jgi:RHS repeat-associated protein
MQPPTPNVDGIFMGKTILGVANEYGMNALGSVTAVRNATGAVSNTYRYKPYGEMISSFGYGSYAYFLYAGAWNYEFLNRPYAPTSAGMRIFDYNSANWNTRDPLWAFGLGQYIYAEADPVNKTDASGLAPEDPLESLKQFPFLKHLFAVPIR